MTTRPARRMFTADEYQGMAAAGILHEDDHVELLEGEIIQMAAIGGRHIATVNRLNDWLTVRLSGKAIVSIQNSIRLSRRSEPEPDVVVLRWRDDFYADPAPPPASAVLLIIEVADSSLPYDRETKIPLYAEAGIPEVWLVDLVHQRVTVYRQPEGSAYQHVTTHERDAVLTLLAFPDLALPVIAMLG